MSETKRNLTYERDLVYLEQRKAEALANVDPYEVVVTLVQKKDAKGKVTLDDDGFPVMVEKKLLRRDLVARQQDERIAAYKADKGL